MGRKAKNNNSLGFFDSSTGGTGDFGTDNFYEEKLLYLDDAKGFLDEFLDKIK